MKMLDIRDELGNKETISLRDFIDKELQDSYYNQGRIECIEEKVNKQHDVLVNLLTLLLESDILSIENIKDDILSGLGYIKVLRVYDEYINQVR